VSRRLLAADSVTSIRRERARLRDRLINCELPVGLVLVLEPRVVQRETQLALGVTNETSSRCTLQVTIGWDEVVYPETRPGVSSSPSG
jgi:hypothetical protein